MFGPIYARSPEGRVNRAAAEAALADTGDVVIAVHGTFAGAPDNDGASWWQRGSPFMIRFTDALAAKTGARPQVLPFHWSGANSEYDRLLAARRLAAVMARLEKAGRPYHVLAHSHGGNVVLEAVNRFTRFGRATPGLRSVTTFGTPYFRKSLKPLSRAFLIYRVCLLIALLLGAVGVLGFGGYLIVMALADQLDAAVKAAVVIGVLVVAGLELLLTRLVWRSVVPMSREEERFAKLTAKSGLGERWLALWAKRDEAIGLLARACAFRPRFVSARGMARSLGRLSSFIAGMVVAVVPFVVYVLAPGVYEEGAEAARGVEEQITSSGFTVGPRLEQALTAAAQAFVWALPVFAAIHLGLSLLFRLGPQHAASWAMNRTIANGVRTGVYGDDAHHTLRGVGPTPERLEVKSQVFDTLDGVSAEDAVEAARALYSELIELDPDGQLEADPAGVWERLSQSIHHNAYFLDEAVIAAAAAHVAANASVRDAAKAVEAGAPGDGAALDRREAADEAEAAEETPLAPA